jgi:hypothetical protein
LLLERNISTLCDVVANDVRLSVVDGGSSALPVGVCSGLLRHREHLSKTLGLLRQLQRIVRMHDLHSQCRIVLAQLGEIWLLSHAPTRAMLHAVVQMSNTLVTSLAEQLYDVHTQQQKISTADAAKKGDEHLFEALRQNFELADERYQELKKMLESMRFSCNKASAAFAAKSIANRRNEAAARMSNLAVSLMTTLASHPSLLPEPTQRTLALSAADQIRTVSLNAIQHLPLASTSSSSSSSSSSLSSATSSTSNSLPSSAPTSSSSLTLSSTQAATMMTLPASAFSSLSKTSKDNSSSGSSVLDDFSVMTSTTSNRVLVIL